MGVLTISDFGRVETAELLDGDQFGPGELRENLRDIERLNRYFGGTSSILCEFDRLVRRRNLRGPIAILDAGTGGADIPRALVRWADRRNLRIGIVACDRSQDILDAAAEWSADYPQIRFLRGDILTLPFPPQSFDVAICALTIHHLDAEDCVILFRKLDEISRHGFIVSDLERSRPASAGAWLITRVLSRNRLTRNDGPLSVRRAFTLHELRRIANAAGCGAMKLRRRPFFRLCGTSIPACSLPNDNPCGTPS